MKNIYKRIIGVLAVLSLIINLIPLNVISAQSNNDINSIAANFLAMALESPSDYGIDNITSTYKLSKEITPYTFDESGLLVPMLGTKYYFIFSNSEAVATLIVNDDPYSVMFESDTAKSLNDFDSESFSIFCDTNGAHITNTTYDTTLDSFTRINVSNNTLKSSAETLTSERSTATTNSVPAGYALSIPIKLQGNYELCWAACIASIYQFKKGVNKTAQDIATLSEIPYNTGATIDQIHEKLASSKVAGIPNTIVYSYYTLTGLYETMSANRVTMGICLANVFDSDPNNDLAHAVIIQGYSASTQGSFLRIMDPNFSSLVMIYMGTTPYGDSAWTFSYGSNNFYWVNSVVTN
ncbi:MAG: Papain-like cysteine protease AvrRpt2 [Herbinix sp.]|jgi:hypothetical protein|nr:Papain-like cysteine protease AvrRpt2 [Herbinix sp.]